MKPFVTAIIVSLLIVIVCLVHALTQRPPYALLVKSEQHAIIGDESPSSQQGKTEEEGTEFWPAIFGYKLKITDTLLVAFTFGLTIFTGLLWSSTDKLWQNAVHDTRILQRAYISVEPGGLSASTSASKCHPNVVIKNAGNLPARQVKWTIVWEADKDGRRSKFPVNEASAEGSNALPPKAEMTQGGKEITVGDGPKDIRRQVGLYLYVWGAVFYEDGFGVNRVTRFCHRYNCRNLEDVTATGMVPIIISRQMDKRFARLGRFGNDAT